MTPAERDKLSEDLSAYLDGELEPPRSLELEALLLESREVRAMLKDLRRIAGQVAELPRVGAPLDLAPTVRQQLDGQAPPLAVRAWAWPMRTYVSVSSAAAAVLLIALAFWTMRPAPVPARPDAAQDAAQELGVALRPQDPGSARLPPSLWGGDAHEPELAGRVSADPRRVEVSEQDLRALTALGYVDGALEDEAAFREALGQPGEPSPAGEFAAADPPPASSAPPQPSDAASEQNPDRQGGASPPAPVVAAAPAPPEADAAAVPLAEQGAGPPAPAGIVDVTAAAPPLVRITVQTHDVESYERALRIADELHPAVALAYQPAGRSPVAAVGEVEATWVGTLLQRLEQPGTDDVQIALSFSARDLPQVRRLLAEPPAAPNAARGAVADTQPSTSPHEARQHIYMQQHPGAALGRELRTASADRERSAGRPARGRRAELPPPGRGGAMGAAAHRSPAEERMVDEDTKIEAEERGQSAAAGEPMATRPPAELPAGSSPEALPLPRTGLLLVDGLLARTQAAFAAQASGGPANRISVGITVLPPPTSQPANRGQSEPRP